MADLADVFGSRFPEIRAGATLFQGGGSPLINIPPPGESGFPGVTGLINDILRRIPIPRPRLPGPTTPTPRGPGRFPIPIPIPFPSGLFSGGGLECPTGPGVNPCCRGEHLNKAKDCAGNLPGTKCVSNRRMNPLNPRALRRSIRRLKGFESFVKRSRSSLRKLSKI